MPIEISCSSCSKRLRVPDNAAGKRVKCPKCQTIISVPAGAGSSKVVGGRYHMKTEDGQTFGPISKKELDEWQREGRVTAECQLLREGADQWQWATDLYPQLEEGGAAETPAAAGSASGGFPNLDTGGSSGGNDDNPFSFAADDLSPTARIGGGARKSAVRGGKVPNYLPLAIFSLLCCCMPLGIPALIFAIQANSKKAQGDHQGAMRSADQAKMWCFIAIGAGLVLSVISTLIQLVALSNQ